MDLLAATCFVIIGFCIFMYVLLDGFDLGIGIIFPFLEKNEKDILMSSILPVWDGNQTWLVLGVAILFGAFPAAFSLLLPTIYLPILLMVTALLLRGITFEFRLKDPTNQKKWDVIFFLSSLVATFIQGLIVGAFVQGFEIDPSHKLLYKLLSPFNLACGISMIFGYALLGSTWAVAKTSKELQQKMYLFSKICLSVVSVSLVVISIWTPYIDPSIWERWFGISNFQKLVWLPILSACTILYFYQSINKKRENILYGLTVFIFFCAYLGFGISTWPYIIPHHITFWMASSPAPSQLFLLIGTLLLLPVLLMYTAYAYYIFRGKVNETIDYH